MYRTVTGSTHFVLSADVEKVLKECKEELLQSLLIFKPYAEPDVDWKPTEYMSLGMQAFIKELGREIVSIKLLFCYGLVVAIRYLYTFLN